MKSNIQSIKTLNAKEQQKLSVRILFWCQIIYVFKSIRASVFSCLVTLLWTAL